jgi:hypothetical protein
MSEDFSKGKRGPVVKSDPNKVRITIRLDADIIEYYKNIVHDESDTRRTQEGRIKCRTCGCNRTKCRLRAHFVAEPSII